MEILNNTTVSFYKNVKDTQGEEKNLFEILSDIKEGKYKETIEKIRKCSSKVERTNLKAKLPAFTVSGLF